MPIGQLDGQILVGPSIVLNGPASYLVAKDTIVVASKTWESYATGGTNEASWADLATGGSDPTAWQDLET